MSRFLRPLARGLFVFWAAVLLALSLLTVVKAPTLTGWKLAIVATQFGHWIAPVALGAALFAGWRARRSTARGWWRGVALAGVVAAGLLFLPAFRSGRRAEALPGDLRAAFGAPTASAVAPRRALSWRKLYQRDGPPPTREATHVFARGEGYALALTCFRPARSDDTLRRRPAIVLVHGGGWDGGSRDELPGFTRWLTTLDAVVFAIDYRLAPRWTWPAPREDTRTALHWVREHAAEFGVDPDRIVLFGRSAGAQIALATAYDAASPPVRGVIAFYGPADLHFAYSHGREDDVLQSLGLIRAYLGGAPTERTAVGDDASPYLHVRHDVPPTLLVHGELDTLVWHRQSERLAARLAEVGARHYFLSLPWATHALEYNLHGPGGQLARAAVADFVDVVAR